MVYDTVKWEGFRFVGAELRTSADDEVRDIPPFWQRFLVEDLASQIPERANDDLIGLYTRYEREFEGEYSLLIGCRVTDLSETPKGMVSVDVPSATYARFHIEGPFPEALVDAWRWVRDSPLKRTYRADLEIYKHGSAAEGDPQMELLIGVDEGNPPEV